jgi:hypothetical protein
MLSVDAFNALNTNVAERRHVALGADVRIRDDDFAGACVPSGGDVRILDIS